MVAGYATGDRALVGTITGLTALGILYGGIMQVAAELVVG